MRRGGVVVVRVVWLRVGEKLHFHGNNPLKTEGRTVSWEDPHRWYTHTDPGGRRARLSSVVKTDLVRGWIQCFTPFTPQSKVSGPGSNPG